MGIHPLCGLYHRRVMSRFESMVASGEHKLGKMLHTGNVIYVDFEDEALFANLNHPNEYDAAVERFNQGDHPEAVGEEKRF
jgi:molybdenum cofactor guanylyltransferase